MTSTIAARIQSRLDALGLTERAASIEATGSDGTIRNIRLGKSTDPRWPTIQKLAAVLKVSPYWLRDGPPAPQEPSAVPPTAYSLGPADVEASDMPTLQIDRNKRDIPIRGTAAGSIIQEVFEGFHLDTDIIGYVARPKALAGATEAYAIWVTGESMTPLHNPADTRLVDPRRPCAPGNSVIVITRHWDGDPGQAYIKILKRRTQRAVTVEQLNPHCEIEIPTEFVVGMHYVLTIDDILRG